MLPFAFDVGLAGYFVVVVRLVRPAFVSSGFLLSTEFVAVAVVVTAAVVSAFAGRFRWLASRHTD